MSVDVTVTTSSERVMTTAADVEATATDGDAMTRWTYVGYDVVEVTTYRRVGDSGFVQDGTDVFDLGEDETVVEFAREHAHADPEEAVRLGRKRFQ